MSKPDSIIAVENWNKFWMARDLEGMKSVATDDYIQWHATVRKELNKEEEFTMLVDALKVKQIKFKDIVLTPMNDDTVLQECVADITIGENTKTDIPFAMVYHTRGQKITRCDEYMDGMSLPPVEFTPQG